MAVAMVAIMLCLALVGCGKKLSGTYEMVTETMGVKSGIEMEFKGNKVTMSVVVAGQVVGEPVEGEYSIKGDKITFTFEGEDAEEMSGEFSFEKGEDYIEIGELGKLTKKD